VDIHVPEGIHSEEDKTTNVIDGNNALIPVVHTNQLDIRAVPSHYEFPTVGPPENTSVQGIAQDDWDVKPQETRVTVLEHIIPTIDAEESTTLEPPFQDDKIISETIVHAESSLSEVRFPYNTMGCY
jgi:hypothetical protein